ncbi:MAG: 2-oxo-4-hydroxy-4-carboxy-5-ureidoimidazoline decarboxylase, partial [Nocardioidaceae bacterium]
ERPAGADPGAAWSRQEQAAVDRDDETARALAEGNRAYEDRFGRVYLVCASGRSGAELLADLRRRLGNDDATEAAVVADELRKIALLRLGKVVTT